MRELHSDGLVTVIMSFQQPIATLCVIKWQSYMMATRSDLGSYC